MTTLMNVKQDYIVKVSKELFLTEGIEKVLIKDIAEKADIGEATIYRYFKKKSNLVIQVALLIQKEISSLYFSFDEGANGIDSIKGYYGAFLSVFLTHQSYFTFLQELDIYILKNDIKELGEYEQGIASFGLIYQKMVEKGLNDGSIKQDIDYETFFYSSTHALLGLCEKLALSKAIIKQDESQKKKEEIEMLIGSFINFIKA